MFKKCLYCGSPLPKPPHGVQRYCSEECRRMADLKRRRAKRLPVWPYEIRKCRQCGHDFLAKRISTVFCSRKCHDRYWTEQKRDRRSVHCLICGKEFLPANKGPALYCSDGCRAKAKQQYYDNFHIRLHPCATLGCTHKTRRKYCWWCRDKMGRTR